MTRGRQRNRGFFSGLFRGVSNPPEGSKILSSLVRPRMVCRARSYISEARGRWIVRTTSHCAPAPKFCIVPILCGKASYVECRGCNLMYIRLCYT